MSVRDNSLRVFDYPSVRYFHPPLRNHLRTEGESSKRTDSATSLPGKMQDRESERGAERDRDGQRERQIKKEAAGRPDARAEGDRKRGRSPSLATTLLRRSRLKLFSSCPTPINAILIVDRPGKPMTWRVEDFPRLL